MNVKKLKKLKKWILAEPRRYRQDYWMYGKYSDVVKEQKPPCGTAGCIAGNACLMEGYKPFKKWVESGHVRKGKGEFYIKDTAKEILGLDDEQSEDLFHADCEGWPIQAKELYLSAKTPLQRAKAAAMAIDDLIERGS